MSPEGSRGGGCPYGSHRWRWVLQIPLVVPQVLQILLVVLWVEMCPSDPIGGPTGRDGSFRSYWWSHRWRCVLQILMVVPQVHQILLVVLQVERCPSDPTGGATDPIGGPMGGDVSFRSHWWSHGSFRSYWWSQRWRCVLQILLVVLWVEMGPSDPTGGATDPTGDPMGGDVSFRSYWWSYG